MSRVPGIKKSFRHLLAVMLMATVVAVGGLGATAHAATVDPCALVTPADIQAAGGPAFAPGTPEAAPGKPAACRFLIGVSPPATFDTEVTAAPTAKAAKGAYKRSKNSDLASAPVKVKGVGNEAYYTTDIGDILRFRKGKTYVTLRLVVFGDDAVVHFVGADAMTTLGKVAVAKLK